MAQPPKELLDDWVPWFLVILTLQAILYPLTYKGWKKYVHLGGTPVRVNKSDNSSYKNAQGTKTWLKEVKSTSSSL